RLLAACEAGAERNLYADPLAVCDRDLAQASAWYQRAVARNPSSSENGGRQPRSRRIAASSTSSEAVRLRIGRGAGGKGRSRAGLPSASPSARQSAGVDSGAPSETR